MRAEIVGYSPESVVRAVEDNAPPTLMVPEAEWDAWAGEAGRHEWLHTQPSRNHSETANVVWEYGVITTTLAIMMPEVINETYLTMKWLYFEVATAAFVQPQGGFEQLPAAVIKESAEAVGKSSMSGPDWETWEQANAELIREAWEQSAIEKIERQEAIRSEQSRPEEPEPQQKDSGEESEKKADSPQESHGIIYPQSEARKNQPDPSSAPSTQS